MFKVMTLVFVGGAIGAIAREFLMLGIPNLHDNFPLSIFVANIVAAFLLGLVTGMHDRGAVNDHVNIVVATGVMGGLSTFSSFIYGSYVLMTGSATGAAVAIVYLLVSLVVGYMALVAGLKIGGRRSVV